VIPNVDKIRAIIQTDIPNVGDKATVGYMKKLTDFDAAITALIPKSEALKDKIVKTFQPIAASREFEDSAQGIIDKVREGIMKQAESNARKKKSGDVIAGETNIRDPRNSGDAQVAGSNADKASAAAKQQRRKQNVDDLSDFLSKKYQKRA
jgi:predicted RecA/RadA family phage recombinase